MSQKCMSKNFDSHFWAKMADLLQPDQILYRRKPQKQTQAPLTNSDIPKGLNIIGGVFRDVPECFRCPDVLREAYQSN